MHINDVISIERRATGLVIINGRLWSLAKARQDFRCMGHKVEHIKGTLAYRPLVEGGGVARNQRVCADFVNAWLKEIP